MDTMDKSHGSLTDILEYRAVERFVDAAKTHGLLCGLAGSLRLDDIPSLLRYRPDYLGFRGALCIQHKRTEELDEVAVAQIKQAIRNGTLLEMA
jgi:uncharacterized protein (UPF0264 family)